MQSNWLPWLKKGSRSNLKTRKQKDHTSSDSARPARTSRKFRFRDNCSGSQELLPPFFIFSSRQRREEIFMKYAFVFAALAALSSPAFAEDVGVGVGVGPVGAGVTVGQDHRDIDRDRDRSTVIKEREPSE